MHKLAKKSSPKQLVVKLKTVTFADAPQLKLACVTDETNLRTY